jgi:sialate O-acetylesterase
MSMPRLAWLAPFLIASSVCLRADVTLAPLFADHGVLQRDKPVPVWGKAKPGESVTVAYRGQTVTAQAGADGRWMTTLAPMPAEAAGADLVVTAGNRLALHDVVVGEVWVCSGQSNMEFTVKGKGLKVAHWEQEVPAARYPFIRQFKVAKVESDTPLDSVAGSWVACSPETVGDFTAVGYFFAREIQRKIRVPIGLVNCTWGGTRIEAWISAEKFASDPAFAPVATRWQQDMATYPAKQRVYLEVMPGWTKGYEAAVKAGEAAARAYVQKNPHPPVPNGPHSPQTPSGIFNGMVNALFPYGIRGVLWYQGESNWSNATEYHRLFTAMITDWRTRFGQGDFPFYWVQLANYDVPYDATKQAWAFLREGQTQTLALPETGQAVIIDIGEKDDIHPHDKQDVGLRLALIARARTYGIPGDFSGPMFQRAIPRGRAMLVTFRYADTGLTAARKPLQSFEVAGADRHFYPAKATIVGNSVLVASPKVPAPVAVRYAWSDCPDANLYSGAGLPACPFRSDTW